jgi:hypothetical protein
LHGQDVAVDHGEYLCNLYNSVSMSCLENGVFLHG